MNVPEIPRIGFFGKLPSRGDFVRAGLSRAFVSAWDAWLQSVWPLRSEQVPVSAPPGRPWRFVLEPDLCGPAAVSGLLLPSTDRIGRRFPLLLAVEGSVASDAWLDGLEPIGRDAVTGVFDQDDLAAHLRRLQPPSPMTSTDRRHRCHWWRPDRTGLGEHRGDAMPDPTAFATFGIS